MGCFKRTASKHVYYLGWNRSPAQAGCMRQVHWEDPEGWYGGGRWEGGSGWGIQVNPWLIHVNVWQKPLQYCKLISLQLIKVNGKKKKTKKKRKKSRRGSSSEFDSLSAIVMDPQFLSMFFVSHPQLCSHLKFLHDHKMATTAPANTSRHNSKCMENKKPFPKAHCSL